MTEILPPPTKPATIAGDAAAAARGGVWLIVLQTLSKASGLAFVMLLARRLGGADVGRYSAVAAIVVFANILADFGTGPAITRMVSRDGGEADRLLSGTLVPSLLFGILLALGANLFGALAYRGATVTDVAIASLAVPGASMLSSVLGALDGSGLIARRAVVTALQTLIVALGVVPVVAGAGVRAAIVTLALAPWVVLVVALGMARTAGLLRSPLRFDGAETRRLVRAALPFALSGGLSALVLRFDVILLSVVRTPAETASYDLAMRLLEATTYLGAAVGGPLLFVLSRRLGQGDRDGATRAYREATRLLYAIGLPLSVVLVVMARPIVEVVLGPGLDPVAMPLAIMGAALWLTFVIMVQGALIMGGDVIGRGIAVGAVIAAVTVALDVILVPLWGPVGAATAMTGSWVFAAAALDRFHRRTVGIATPRPGGRVLLATAAMALVLVTLREAPLPVAGAAAALAYGAGMVLTGAFGRGDVARVREAVFRSAA